MPIHFIDSLDLYSSLSDLQERYGVGGAPSFSTTSGRFGGGGVQTLSTNYYISRGVASTDEYVIGGCAVKFATLPSVDVYFLSFNDSSSIITNNHFAASLNSSGTLSIKSSTTTLTTSSLTITAGVWYYIELRGRIHATLGEAYLYVNGVLYASITGADTFRTSYTSIYFNVGQAQDSISDPTFDDLYFESDASSLPTAKGDPKIVVQSPNADTATEQWTRSAGVDSYALIDDTGGGDGDTTYISDTTLNNQTLVDITNIAETPASIHAVQLVSRASKTDAGTIEYTHYVVSGATTSYGSAVNPTETAYTVTSDVYETDPNTAAAWTESAVNALQIGVEITG